MAPASASLICATLLALLVPGCAEKGEPQTPSFYLSLDQPQAMIDVAAAASMINGYRQNSGLSPLLPSEALNAAARELTEKMAAADSINISLKEKPLAGRLAEKGYPASAAQENVSAGYRTLAEAFSGWRESKPHDAVMKLSGATHLGIATAYAPQSKYKVYWALIVARER